MSKIWAFGFTAIILCKIVFQLSLIGIISEVKSRFLSFLNQISLRQYSGINQGFISIIERSILTAKEFPCDDVMISFLNSNPELRKYISKKMKSRIIKKAPYK